MFLGLLFLEARNTGITTTVMRELDSDYLVVDSGPVVVTNGTGCVTFVLVDQGDGTEVLTKLVHVEVAVEKGAAL